MSNKSKTTPSAAAAALTALVATNTTYVVGGKEFTSHEEALAHAAYIQNSAQVERVVSLNVERASADGRSNPHFGTAIRALCAALAAGLVAFTDDFEAKLSELEAVKAERDAAAAAEAAKAAAEAEAAKAAAAEAAPEVAPEAAPEGDAQQPQQ